MREDPYNAVITWVEAAEQPRPGPLSGRTLLVKDLLHACDRHRARDHNGTDVRTDAFQLFKGLDGPNTSGCHPDPVMITVSPGA